MPIYLKYNEITGKLKNLLGLKVLVGPRQIFLGHLKKVAD